jgi:alkylation response protein AidB-like acyl-CoA dehydrogenase
MRQFAGNQRRPTEIRLARAGMDRETKMEATASSEAAGPEHVARARALAPLISASADEIERGRRLTEPVVKALIEGGFYRMLLPKSFGGTELAPAYFMAVLEEIAKADASTAWCLGQCGVCAMVAAYLEPDTAREIFDPHPGVLAWGSAAGEVHAVSGGYRATYRWTFASGCRQAGWLGAHVHIIEPDGKKRLKPDGTPVLRTILFPIASATLHDVWDVIGLKGTGTDNYSVSDLFIPERYSALRDDPAASHEAGTLYRLTTSMMFGLGFATIALGVARAVLDASLVVARGKASPQVKHAMRDNNVVQGQIGRNEAKLRAARAYLYGSVNDVWRDLTRPAALTTEHRIALRLASSWAIHQAVEVVDSAYHMTGATAIFHSNPFERRFRDIHAIAQQIQARDIHYETVGQVLLGLDPDAPVFAT